MNYLSLPIGRHFFTVYKQLEGKKTEIKGVLPAQSARDLIMRHYHAYEAAREDQILEHVELSRH